MKAKIIKAIKNGNHKTRDIIPAIGAELRYREFCKAIFYLQAEGKIVATSNGYEISK